MTDGIIAVSRPLVSVNDLIGGSMRAVRGVWDSGANTIRWVVELEGAVTRRGKCCVGVIFAFPVSMCENCLYRFAVFSLIYLAFSLLYKVMLL